MLILVILSLKKGSSLVYWKVHDIFDVFRIFEEYFPYKFIILSLSVCGIEFPTCVSWSGGQWRGHLRCGEAGTSNTPSWQRGRGVMFWGRCLPGGSAASPRTGDIRGRDMSVKGQTTPHVHILTIYIHVYLNNSIAVTKIKNRLKAFRLSFRKPNL